MLPRFLVRMLRRGKYRHKFGQRLAIYSQRVRDKLAHRQACWIHAVSVGEVRVALRLIARWQARNTCPASFVLSTTTSTGFALAEREAPQNCEIIYNPVDFWPIASKAVQLIRPQMLVLVEAEVWPNLVARVKRSGAPVVLVNARMSPRSEARFVALGWLVAPIFRMLDAICVQDEDDVAIWQRIGIDGERIHHCGGIKYDAAAGNGALLQVEKLHQALALLAVPKDAPIIVAGSTHAGEERILASALHSIHKHVPAAFLVVVPRHVERASEVRDELQQAGLTVVRKSAIETPQDSPPDCLLVDVTGELAAWYGLATVAFIGKSLTAKGGQNPVEAIHAGCPVVCGPHMENFRALMKSLNREQAVVQVADGEQLATALAELLADPQRCRQLVTAANRALMIHSGATECTLDVLDSCRQPR